MTADLVSKEAVLRSTRALTLSAVLTSGGSLQAAHTVAAAIAESIEDLKVFPALRHAPEDRAAQQCEVSQLLDFARFVAASAKHALDLAERACGDQTFTGLAVAARHVVQLQWACNTARSSAATLLEIRLQKC